MLTSVETNPFLFPYLISIAVFAQFVNSFFSVGDFYIFDKFSKVMCKIAVAFLHTHCAPDYIYKYSKLGINMQAGPFAGPGRK